MPEPPAKGALPSVEEPLRFPAAPGPPGVGAKPPHFAEPPAGIAPHIAHKFAERPPLGGALSSRGFAFSVMGWSFPAAPPEWPVQEGFGLQQSATRNFRAA